MKYRSNFSVGCRIPERRHHLGQHPLLLSRIARREVKRLDTAHIGFPRYFSGGRRCKMGPVPRQCGIRPRERRLDKEDVRILNERHDGGAIGRRVGNVGNIGNFLAGSDRQEVTRRLPSRSRRPSEAAAPSIRIK